MRSVVIVFVLLLLGFGAFWLTNRPAAVKVSAPIVARTNHIPATHPRAFAVTNASPETGFYIGNGDERVYINYSTSDPVLQSFMQSIMDRNSDPDVQGKEIFSRICAACHQKDGEGKDGVAPPLVGSEWTTNSAGKRMIRIALNGLSGPIRVRGKEWNMSMPPWRENLNDEQLSVVLTYIRTQLGNHARPIAPETVADVRNEMHGKTETADELLRIADP